MDLRWALPLLVISMLLARPALSQPRGTTVVPAALTSFDRVKAETLLRAELPCLGCHSLNGDGGKLAPELATVRDRRAPDYIARMIADPQRTLPGTLMPHTPMPANWRALITRYLGGTDQPNDVSHPTLLSAADSNGAELYGRFCSGCHGAGGRGDGPNAKSLPVPPARHASRDVMSLRSDDGLYDTIAGGGAVMNRSPRMPVFGTTLAPAQIRALVRHIRSLCQCAGPAWSTDNRGTTHE